MPKDEMTPLGRVHAAASHAAIREHVRLGTKLSQRVDIFSIIERAGIWLMFQPCPNLYGAYLPIGDALGIIINSAHPLSLQRFTAAHEYGHHVLKHRPSLDDSRRIQTFGAGLDPQEAAAQAFAANFIMPLPLVNAALKQLNLPIDFAFPDPRQVYLLSLELGVSYAAAVNHLVTLNKISRASVVRLRQWTPKTIKTTLGGGVRPQDAWADVWPLHETDDGKLLYPRVNDELRVSLPEVPSTGYLWSVSEPAVVDLREAQAAPAENYWLALLRDEFRTSGSPEAQRRLGADGLRDFSFKVLKSGRQTLRLVKRRPWLAAEPPVETFSVVLNVQAKPTGTSDRGLSEYHQVQIAVAA